MKIQDHIEKISWAVIDKLLVFLYGVLFLFQMDMLGKEDFALYGILLGINTYIIMLSDAFALQPVIQFGNIKSERPKVNIVALLLHVIILMGFSWAIFLFRNQFGDFFNEPRIVEVATVIPWFVLSMLPRTYLLKFLLRDHDLRGIFFANLVLWGILGGVIIYYKFNGIPYNYQLAVNYYIIAAWLSSVFSLFAAFRKLELNLNGNIKIKQILSFSLPFTVTNAFNNLPRYLDQVILLKFFDTTLVSEYMSAKSMFRFFEEGNNAANGLIYPAAVRHAVKDDKTALNTMVKKAISFLFISYLAGAILLWSGLADIIVELILSEAKYAKSLIHFDVLLFSALAMPFTILYFIITAGGKYYQLLRITMSASILSLATIFICGYFGQQNLMGLGIVVYAFSLAAGTYYYSVKQMNIKFGLSELFSSIWDIISYAKSKLRK